jgi:hypothetical protein
MRAPSVSPAFTAIFPSIALNNDAFPNRQLVSLAGPNH